jgi:dipeptidyl aminopeptidase/acylaminoacyl peptidase
VSRAPLRWQARAWVAALAVAAAAGCATGRIELGELPDHPIAIAYWDYEQARDRAERREDRERREAQAPREGVASAGSLASLFGLERHDEPTRFLGRLALVDPHDGEVTVLRQATPGAYPLAWSADGSCLLFSSTHRGGRQLFEWDRKSGEVRQLTHGEARVTRAAYGPDRRVVFASLEGEGRTLRSTVWVTGAGGANPRQLTAGPADHSPTWSPDGKTIVFVRQDAGQGSLLVARPPEPGGEEHVLGHGEQPSFSPEGDWVVYVARLRAGRRIWRIRPDGSGKLPVGRGQFDERQPTVSPDGRFVAFVADQDDRERLYVRRMDGSGDRMLIEDGDGSWPAW